MAGDAIIAEDLTYLYGDLLAVDHISFRVAEGQILGFLGPNVFLVPTAPARRLPSRC